MSRALLAAALVASVAGSAAAAPAPGGRLNFLACPLIRDTEPTCWIAKYNGETYYLGSQRSPTESYPPQMKHQVLVEGEVTGEPRVCGGIVLKPVRLSVMPELDLSCDSPVLPGDGLTPPTLAPRAPLASRPRDVVGGIGSAMRVDAPKPPFDTREFVVDFDFGRDLLTDQMQRRMIEALTYAKAVDPRRITVKGYAAATLLSNSRALAEPVSIAEQRAQKMARILTNLGAPKDVMQVEWATAAEPGDGISDFTRRRVVVTVEPKTVSATDR